MVDKLEQLKVLLKEGTFHHATWRDIGKLWEGWHIYVRAEDGFRGFKHELAIYKTDPECDAAGALISGTGYSVGSYGNG